jgi:hypothetical protein
MQRFADVQNNIAAIVLTSLPVLRQHVRHARKNELQYLTAVSRPEAEVTNFG